MGQRRQAIKDKILGGKDRVSVTLYLIYVIFLVVAVVVIAALVNIHYFYKVDPKIERLFRPRVLKRVDEPRRGDILARDGRILATSKPLYQIYMDCTVRKAEYREAPKGDSLETVWRNEALELARGLAAIYRDKTGDEYYDLIISGRDNGRQYVKIGYPIDHETYLKATALPLFCGGAYKGGIITEKRDSRIYPYGGIARRTIGYVKSNSDAGASKNIGIEGKYDAELHGVDGYEWLRVTDKLKMVHNADSASVKAVDGMDIRTTIDVDLQDITDKALRRQIEDDPKIGAACAIILDVKTGAVRAMVNLQRDTTSGSPLEERYNLALGQVGEQGSVFKTVALTSLVEDGYVKNLTDSIPTNGGIVKGGYNLDDHIRDYERQTGRKHITVLHGFEISSNYVFTYLATKYYGSNPQKYFDHIDKYQFSGRFDFDIPGLGTPQVTAPGSKYWNKLTLGTVAYGYGIAVSPLHVATFYNALANRGRMMKPYLIESFERNGKVIEKHGPSDLGTICSEATADTLRRALLSVTKEGTARRLKDAKLPVAGKTGTARVVLSANEKPRKGDAYHDAEGRMKNQGSFAGYFPADDPQYTVFVTIYSYLSRTSYYGGTAPALAVKEIVDNVYAMDTRWSESVAKSGEVPVMAAPPKDTLKGVPALKGLGLKDAVYMAENAGYKCTYEGSGHVVSQTPAPGTKASRGSVVNIVLK